MSIDPKRIVEEEGGSLLAAMLSAAQQDGLAPEQVDRVRAGLVATAIVAGGATAATVKQTGFLASLSTTVGIALAVVSMTAGSNAWLARKDLATVAAHPIPTARPSPPSDPVPSTTSLPDPQIAAVPSAAKAAPHPGRPLPAATPTAPQAPTAQPASPHSAIPDDEGVLLLEARRALQDDPARALDLVREHERRFPNSQLAPERARIAAEAARRSR